MASDLDFVQFVVDQVKDAENIHFKKMFGEYGLYYKDKIIGLICDNRLFIKPTEKGKCFIGFALEEAPYPGAKKSFIIEEKLEDKEWITELIHITYDNLPKKPVAKVKKNNKSLS